MAGLQRSMETFRRSGSSGLVWEDRFLGSEDQPKQPQQQTAADMKPSTGVGPLEQNRSNGYRTGCVSPTLDPPSPKISGCGFCGIFGEDNPKKKNIKTRKK